MNKSRDELLDLILDDDTGKIYVPTGFKLDVPKDAPKFYDPKQVIKMVTRVTVAGIKDKEMYEAYNSNEFEKAKNIATKILEVVKQAEELGKTMPFIGCSFKSSNDDPKSAGKCVRLTWRDYDHLVNDLHSDAKSMLARCEKQLNSKPKQSVKDRLAILKLKTKINKKFN